MKAATEKMDACHLKTDAPNTENDWGGCCPSCIMHIAHCIMHTAHCIILTTHKMTLSLCSSAQPRLHGLISVIIARRRLLNCSVLNTTLLNPAAHCSTHINAPQCLTLFKTAQNCSVLVTTQHCSKLVSAHTTQCSTLLRTV